MGKNETIHVLELGVPVCGFSRKAPSKWPGGHVYVSAVSAIQNSDIGKKVSCVTCTEVVGSRLKNADKNGSHHYMETVREDDPGESAYIGD